MLQTKVEKKKWDISKNNYKKEVDKYNKSDSLIISGDLNARVGNQPIPNVIGTFGETYINRNGQTLKEFASFNDFKITNTFIRKKETH